MIVDRRLFLKGLGSGIVTLGVNWSYPLQAFANSSNRRFALLLGINNYQNAHPDLMENRNLKGCLTDVELQQDLLQYRWGLSPTDVFILTNEQVSCSNIEDIIKEQLSPLMTPNDGIMIHFSGYGVEIETSKGKKQGWLMGNGEILLTEVFKNLVGLLNTSQIVIINDTSYTPTPSPLEGNLQVRSAILPLSGLNPSELQNFFPKTFFNLPNKPLKGIIISATDGNSYAVEKQWEGFSSGLFTHSLTQCLWQSTQPNRLLIHLQETCQTIYDYRGNKQLPKVIFADNFTDKKLFFNPPRYQSYQGVITAIHSEDETIEITLTGLALSVINQYQVNSYLTLNTSEGLDNFPALQVMGKSGLHLIAKFVDTTQKVSSILVGKGVTEFIRVIPKKLGLTIALSPDLDKLEKVDAVSELSKFSFVTSKIFTGEKSADCLLGKITDTVSHSVSYHLFSVGNYPLGNPVMKGQNAIQVMVRQFADRLEAILGLKYIRSTQNESASKLLTRITLEEITETGIKLISKRQSFTYVATGKVNESIPLFPEVSKGNKLQYQLENLGDFPLYWLIIGFDADGQLKIIPPNNTLNHTLYPNSPLTVAMASSESLGLGEWYVIISRSTWVKTLQMLAELGLDREAGKNKLELNDPLPIVTAILEDLTRYQSLNSFITIPPDSYGLDMSAWTTFRFIYETK